MIKLARKSDGNLHSVSSKKAYKTAEILFTELGKEKLLAYSSDDYFEGAYYASLSEEIALGYVSQEEEKAAKVLKSYLKREVSIDIEIIDYGSSFYVPAQDKIVLSSKFRECSSFLKKSDLQQILFMSYLYEEGCRNLYKTHQYDKYVKTVAEAYQGKELQDKKGQKFVYTKVTEAEWATIIRYKFRKELEIWEYCFKVQGIEDIDIDMSDFYKYRNYRLFETMCSLHQSNLDKSIEIFDNYVFYC